MPAKNSVRPFPMKRRIRDAHDQLDVLQLARFERANPDAIHAVEDAENLRFGSQEFRRRRNVGNERGRRLRDAALFGAKPVATKDVSTFAAEADHHTNTSIKLVGAKWFR